MSLKLGEPSVIDLRNLIDELIPAQAPPVGWKILGHRTRLAVECNHRDAFEQVGCIAFGLPAAGTDEPPNGSLDEVRRRLPLLVAARPLPLFSGKRQDAAHDGEGKLEVNIHGEGSYVAKAVPDGTADCEMHGLDFDRQPDSIQLRHFREVRLDRPQATSNASLAGNRSGERVTLAAKVGQGHAGKRG
ncbi:MAG: hypothetical protein R2754_14120 [Microthrixaceae bacterium]